MSDDEDYGDEHRGRQPTEALAIESDREKMAEMLAVQAKTAIATLDNAAIAIVCGAMSLPWTPFSQAAMRYNCFQRSGLRRFNRNAVWSILRDVYRTRRSRFLRPLSA